MLDLSAHNLPAVFRELSRLGDGDHALYVRTEPHNLFEVRRAGVRSLPSTALAAFIPDAVIKLQTPMAASIIASVPSRQGSATLHTRTNLFIVDNMADTVNLIQHHRAAFIREDSALAVWAKDVQSALVALRQILAGLDVLLVGHDVAFVDANGTDGETTGDSRAAGDAFDEFIDGYDDPADKQEAANFLPLRTLDDDDERELTYAGGQSNLFDSLSADSLMLGGSPFLSSAVSSCMSRLCLNGTLHAPPSPTFSAFDFEFASPSPSSNSASDGSVFSTPLTIAPSVLSSPLSVWSSPPLPTISESYLEEPLQDTLSVHSAGDSSTTEAPSKRKRSPKAKQGPLAGAAAPEKTRPRRTSRAATSPKVAPSPSPRARRAVPKAVAPAPVPSKRVVSPLPARSGRSRSSSVSSTSSTASRSSARLDPKTTRSRAAQLTLPRVTHAACCGSDSEHEHGHDHEILESDDSGSEYEADPSELELDELDDEDEDDEYRPAKRARSLPSTRAASPASTVKASPVRRKAVSPKVASAKKAAPKKKKRSSFGCASSKKKKPAAKPEGPPPTCVWCDQEFTRESDVLRHEKHSCKWYPFDQEPEYCKLCDKEISRNDAVLRHKNSGDCEKRQSELREQGLLPPKAKTKTVASARAAAKKAAATVLPTRRRSTRSSSV